LVDKRFILKRLPILLPIKSPLHNTLGITHRLACKDQITVFAAWLTGLFRPDVCGAASIFSWVVSVCPEDIPSPGAVAKGASRRYDGADPPAKIGVSRPEVQRLRVWL